MQAWSIATHSLTRHSNALACSRDTALWFELWRCFSPMSPVSEMLPGPEPERGDGPPPLPPGLPERSAPPCLFRRWFSSLVR